MNYIKVLFSFSLGITAGYFVFSRDHKSSFTSDFETQGSMSNSALEEFTKLKEDLSSCERREQIASSELSELRENLSQGSTALGREITGEGGSTSKSTFDYSDESGSSDSEKTEKNRHDKDLKSEMFGKEKNEFLKSAKWLEAEKDLDALVVGDGNSRLAFLKHVSIKDFDKVLGFTDRVDRKNQSFIALQGSYQGQMKDLLIEGREYRLELELNFPAQGDGIYSASVSGEGLNLSTQGRGEARGFSTLKDTGSRAVFLKLNREVYLQLYSNGTSNTVIGNAYRNSGDGFAKFGEFELIRM